MRVDHDVDVLGSHVGVDEDRAPLAAQQPGLDRLSGKDSPGDSPASHYTRLEQGLSCEASAEVLDAIARALLLDGHGREHLDRLAGAARRTPRARRPRPEDLADETRDLFRVVDGVPALVLGRRADVLAWNTLGHCSPEQALVVCATPAGSPSVEALALLRQTTGGRTPHADDVVTPRSSLL